MTRGRKRWRPPSSLPLSGPGRRGRAADGVRCSGVTFGGRDSRRRTADESTATGFPSAGAPAPAPCPTAGRLRPPIDERGAGHAPERGGRARLDATAALPTWSDGDPTDVTERVSPPTGAGRRRGGVLCVGRCRSCGGCPRVRRHRRGCSVYPAFTRRRCSARSCSRGRRPLERWSSRISKGAMARMRSGVVQRPIHARAPARRSAAGSGEDDTAIRPPPRGARATGAGRATAVCAGMSAPPSRDRPRCVDPAPVHGSAGPLG